MARHLAQISLVLVFCKTNMATVRTSIQRYTLELRSCGTLRRVACWSSSDVLGIESKPSKNILKLALPCVFVHFSVSFTFLENYI